MAGIDWIILTVAVAAAVYGFWKGLISQMGAVVALVLAVIACRLFGGSAADAISGLLGDDNSETSATVAYGASVIGNMLVFIIVYLVTLAIARGIKMLSRIMLLGLPDKLLGAVFTIVEWMTGLSIALNLWCATFPDSDLTRASTLGDGMALKIVMELAPMLLGMLDVASMLTHAPI